MKLYVFSAKTKQVDTDLLHPTNIIGINTPNSYSNITRRRAISNLNGKLQAKVFFENEVRFDTPFHVCSSNKCTKC